jgi:tetratricopeptide (TPR) repeat protein
MFAPADPRPVKEIVAAAEELVTRKAYHDASELYTLAIAKEPGNGRYYLRRGELLEVLDKADKARAVYQRGLDKVGDKAPEYQQLAQSLALLCATDLYDLDTAEKLLGTLPLGSVQRLDLSAYLYLQTGQSEEALKLLNMALPRAEDSNQKAMILYHAALIYDQFHDEKNTFTSLYHAINNASNLALIRKIEAMWMKISGSQPLPQSPDTPR